MADLDPKRLLVLAAIAEEGGVGPAARALGLTPSAVSQQLSRLEQDVAVPLVDRTGGRLALTSAGRLLARHGQQIERTLASAAHELTAWTEQLTGRVAIGAMAEGIAVVADALSILARDHPDLEPVAVEVDWSNALTQLRTGELDVLMVSDDRDTAIELPQGIVATPLLQDNYRLVVPATWPVPQLPLHLSGRPWISGPPRSARGRAFARFIRDHNLRPSHEHVAAQPVAVRMMLAAGLGAAILPEFSALVAAQATVCPIPVSGSFMVRILRRVGATAAVPAVEAAVTAIRQSALLTSERYADSDPAAKEVIVRQLTDPSVE